MDKEEKLFVKIIIGAIVGFIALVFILSGPAGCSNSFTAWKASAYGSDWFIIQYAVDGSIINSWKIKNKAIHNEGSSDGIYFVNEENEVVHLSGHYVYIQNPSEETCKRLLKKDGKLLLMMNISAVQPDLKLV